MPIESLLPILFGLVIALAILHNLLAGNFHWGWPTGRVQRAEYPGAFWAYNGFLALVAAYSLVEGIQQL